MNNERGHETTMDVNISTERATNEINEQENEEMDKTENKATTNTNTERATETTNIKENVEMNEKQNNTMSTNENTEQITANNADKAAANATVNNSEMEKYVKELFESDGIILDCSGAIELYDGNGDINLNVFQEMLNVGKGNMLLPMADILDGTGYKAYAIFCDEGGGKRNIGIKLAFADGEISEMIHIRQADFLKMVEYLRIKAKSIKNPIKTTKISPEQRVYENFRDSIQDYQRRDSMLDTAQIINALDVNYNRIRDERTMIDIEQLAHVYNKLYSSVTKLGGEESVFTVGKKESKYFRIMSGLFKSIADEVKMTDLELAKFLYERGLLLVPKNSVGYQTKVHYPYVTGGEYVKKWIYCVLKPSHFYQAQKVDTNF